MVGPPASATNLRAVAGPASFVPSYSFPPPAVPRPPEPVAPPRTTTPPLDPERRRLAETRDGTADWKRFGPWLAERAWGTVREDYSADGEAWGYLPYEEARRTAYRWNEDGLAGLCDGEQYVCFALAFWNGRDDHLKERIYGLSGSQGNHGEDAKEQWWYADATPTASWLRWHYRYPQQAFPYEDLRATNAARGKLDPEYELADTGVLDRGYWDLDLAVAKADPDDLVLRLTVTNAGPATDTLHVLPTLWLRDTWTWRPGAVPPTLTVEDGSLVARHKVVGEVRLRAESGAGPGPQPLVCDNVTDLQGRYGVADGPAYPKNGIGDHVVHGAPTVNPAGVGTKGALHHQVSVEPGASVTLTWHLGAGAAVDADAVLAARAAEADAFHDSLLPTGVEPGSPRAVIARQALAGLVWGQCFYHYNVQQWLDGDPGEPPPPQARRTGRNSRWWHLDNREVISMPDAWEYPWYAAWDLAFHTVALAHADPDLAKEQLLLLCREWYMAPSGQLPAYEWDFGDVNPPVHAWAALEVFHISGGTDTRFLERIFHKLLINHTWWTNREDVEGNNVFEGGFLGLDNIGAFDRSHLPAGAGQLEQADATAWMATYTLDLLGIALNLARTDPAYEDVATKFFEHFTYIARAMDSLWDEQDGFFYDVLEGPDGTRTPVRIRSVAGLVSLCAARVIRASTLEMLPDFAARFRWFVDHHDAGCVQQAANGDYLLAAVSPDRLRRVLAIALDENELLSPHGLRSLSKAHAEHPFSIQVAGSWTPPVDYEPAESTNFLFGGNSNWRGPVWMPLNALIITALRRVGRFQGGSMTAALSGGPPQPLDEIGDALADRLVSLLVPGPGGQPPAAGPRNDWPEGLLLFHEYFHGDTGAGLGASHQTGWTALLADLVLRPHG
jgi:hypothetical protein